MAGLILNDLSGSSLSPLLNALGGGYMQDLSYTVPYGFEGPLFIWTPNIDPPYTMGVAAGGTGLAFDTETGVVATTTAFGSEQTRSITLEASGAGGTPYVSITVTFTSEAGVAPSFGISAASAQMEGISGTTVFNFPITLINHQSGSNSVNWAVTGSGGNPANAADFVGGVLPSGTLNFTDDGTQFAVVNVAGDATVEPDEGFTVTLSSPTNGAIIGTASASSTILTDDTVYGPVAAPVLTGNPALFASLDPANLATITLDVDGKVSSIAGADGTARTYTGSSANGSGLPALAVSSAVQTIAFVEALQQFLNRNDGSGVSTNSTSGRCTIVAIYERTDASANNLSITTIGQASQPATTNQLSLLATASGFLTRKGGAGSNTTITQGAQDQNRHLHIGVMTNNVTSPVAYLDGGTGATGTTANWPTTLDNTKIGARTASNVLGSFGSWRLCRWLLYDAVLNATQAEEIAVWAASNYGTPNG